MTDEVVRLIGRLQHKPAVLVSGSAIGWYGLWQRRDADRGVGRQVVLRPRAVPAWERAALRGRGASACRVVRLRIGLVLGTEGGMLGRLLTPFEFGLGGPIGTGRQWMSWIERDDIVRLIAHVIAKPDLAGPVNATAPEPVHNAAFTRALADAPCTGRPCSGAGRLLQRSLAISRTSCCWAGSGWCRPRRSPAASCSGI